MRAPWWNYSWGASYFITINTKNKIPYFGYVINNKMNLSYSGKITQKCWVDIVHHFKDVTLGPFVVMPNHIHGIINLHDKNDLLYPWKTNRFQNQGKKSISSIIGSFKAATSKKIHRAGLEFKWHSRFYDRIIRNENEYCETAKYIQDNPTNW